MIKALPKPIRSTNAPTIRGPEIAASDEAK